MKDSCKTWVNFVMPSVWLGSYTYSVQVLRSSRRLERGQEEEGVQIQSQGGQ